MSINKFTKFTFAFVSAGVLSVVIGSSLVTNAQSSTSNNSSNSNNSVNTRFDDQERGNFGGFFGKMGKGAKNGIENMKSGKFKGKMMGKMGDKMDKRMESEAAKYKIDAGVVKAVTDAQKVSQDAQTAVRDGRKNKVSNLGELETKVRESRKNVQTAMKKFKSALFDAKVSEAKTLGVDQTIIDKFVTANKTKTDAMDKMENLKNNPETKVGEIETLGKSMKESRQNFRDAQKDFRTAVKIKSPTSSTSQN